MVSGQKPAKLEGSNQLETCLVHYEYKQELKSEDLRNHHLTFYMRAFYNKKNCQSQNAAQRIS
jgi:hypothetical protein